MKKILFLTVFFVLLSSLTTATTISNEKVVIDLQKQTVRVSMHVEEFSGSSFSYLSSVPVSDLTTTVNKEKISCRVETLRIGSEILCNINNTKSFNITFKYSSRNLASNRKDTKVFEYVQSFYRPTRDYRLKVVLPPNAAIVNKKNLTQPVIKPEKGEIGSGGRRIYVTWNIKPDLGDSVDFHIFYEELESTTPWNLIALSVFLGVVIAGSAYFFYLRLIREDIEDVYPELSEDQKKILDILVENDGEMLQKDVVDSSDFSKAKVSGIVSELVEEEVLTKEKHGRSNKLKVSNIYRV